ncbi:DMT family transporter [Mannheimia sp. AT1]|uniref:DMT family transporter n=1 Tax=Mannheimia cairinae TaxID=3025936 RepID=A0ABT5MRY2_9PAST|nr:DMT family transporter [Mannheimia cairinae]MDD0824226.1 DMT family transporter [Mannheimia cairinae]MDD0826651.1 DMT family transporter [Mannheimia cairinae]
MITFIIGILAGVGIAFQSAVNARLRLHLGSPFLTSLVSFSVGLTFLFTLSLLLNKPLQFHQNIFEIAPFWAWTGGFLGMIALTINVLIFPKLGGVQTAVMPILGQVIMGILIDSFGWLNAPQIAFSGNRILGIALVLLGVFVAVVLPNLRTLKNKTGGNELWLWRAVGVLGGISMATQAAVNGELGNVLGSPLSSAIVSFLVGTLGLLFVVIFYEKSVVNLVKSTKEQPFWMWLGGVLAGSFIFASVWLVPQIGTGSVVMLMLLGLISGSILVDRFGLFSVVKKAILPSQIIGIVLLLAGVACIRVF